MPNLHTRTGAAGYLTTIGLLALGIATAGLAPGAAHAADAPTTVPSASAEPGKVKKTELHEHMQAIEDAFKKLRRTLRKPDGSAESLTLIGTVKKEATICRDMTPSRAGTLPEADRAKFVDDFRKGMDGFIAQVGELETAVRDGDNEKAQTLYKGLKSREDDGHDKFMQQDEKEKSDAK